VPRAFSTRRFTFTYALVVAVLVALVANLFHAQRLRRQEALLQRRLGALQHLLVTAYREIPAERFPFWLSHVDFRAWAAPGWNLLWLAPDQRVRWSVQTPESDAFAPEILAAIRALNDETNRAYAVRNLRVSAHGRSHLVELHRLAPGDSTGGVLLMDVPLPRFFADASDFWISMLLLFLILLAVFVAFQRALLRHLRRLVRASGIPGAPPPRTDQPIETWAEQHVTLASRRISEERDHFDALFDLLQDGTLVLDGDNRIVRANATAARLLGAAGPAPIGRPLAELADGKILEALAADIRAAGAFRTAEIALRDGALPCSGAGIPLHAESEGAGLHVMLVLRDISRVRQLERAGEEYATNVSHELKTPLTLILGYTETLLSQADMEPAFRERSLRTIEHHAKRILRIIDDLLRLAWLKNERESVGRVPRAPVPVASVAAEAIASCREWARNAGIAIETHIPDGLVWSLHAGLMEEALVNLVKNAILYALVGPVEIRARVLANGHLEMAVVDRGPGLKPDDAQRIFDRFYRADKGRARAAGSSGGSGLGLPIVQQIVEAHSGTARVETAPGEGCTFLLEIPPA